MKKLLNGIRRLMIFLLGAAAGIGFSQAVRQRVEEQSKKEQIISPLRFETGFQLLDRWLRNKEEGRNIVAFFTARHYEKIAVYGMGVLGEHLCIELKDTAVSVMYGIDRLANKEGPAGIPVVASQEARFEGIDAIIVTPVQSFWAIEDMLEEKTDAAILSLEEVLYGA